MTIWDNIYQNYQKGGQAYATLSDNINPLFVDFVQHATFPTKSALDIGCGTGVYLQLLQKIGFKIAGIDSSPTAIAMSKELLGDEADIKLADMYRYKIPKNKYDLIFSIATIHHGTKNQIQTAINDIHTKLRPDGKIFITLPSYDSSNKWQSFKNKQEIASGTFKPLSGPEQGLAHSFFTEGEVRELFRQFEQVTLSLDNIGRWTITAAKQ